MTLRRMFGKADEGAMELVVADVPHDLNIPVTGCADLFMVFGSALVGTYICSLFSRPSPKTEQALAVLPQAKLLHGSSIGRKAP